MSDDERTFSDEEFRAILSRAVELQDRVGRVSRPGELSLREIKQIAGEVGVDPVHVERAVSHLPSARRSPLAPFTGAPWSWADFREVEGEVPEEEMGRLVDTIRATVGQPGEVETLYGAMEWRRRSDGLGPVHVRVTPRDGRTRVEVQADRGGAVFLIFFLVPFAGLMAGAVLQSLLSPATAWGTVGLLATGLLGGYVAARSWWTALADRWKGRIHRVLESVASGTADIIERRGDASRPAELSGGDAEEGDAR